MNNILIHEIDIYGKKRLIVCKIIDGQIVGSCLADFHLKTPLAYSLFVNNEYREQGIGSELVKAIINYSAEKHKKALCVNIDKGNGASIFLHEKLGFKLVFDYEGSVEDMWSLDLVPYWNKKQETE